LDWPVFLALAFFFARKAPAAQHVLAAVINQKAKKKKSMSESSFLERELWLLAENPTVFDRGIGVFFLELRTV
jgi:hypothetical protein